MSCKCGSVEPVFRGKEWLSCRDVLWVLTITGFATTILLEANVAFTIVAMVVPRPQPVFDAQCKYDVTLTSNYSTLRGNATSDVAIDKEHVAPHIQNPSSELQSTSQNITSPSPVQYANRLSWNEYEQGLALGGIMWAQWVTQLPGGFLARRYGTKFIFGWSIFTIALLGFLLPFSAYYNLYAFVFIRVVQGFLGGFVYPAMHNMMAKWIPLHERNKFMSAYVGNSVGMAISSILYAIIITSFGWESVFYVTSVIGVIWSIAWYYLVFDTPQEHPRISEEEKAYILGNLGKLVDYVSSQSVPWKAILTSGPLWMLTIVGIGGNWGFLTLYMEAPSYFNYVHGWNISAMSIFSSVPHVGRTLFSYVFSKFADWLLRTKKMSTTNLRKFATLICNGFQGILLLGLAFSGCHPTLAIIFIIAGLTVSGALSVTALAGCIDLSPNYASIIYGISNTVLWWCSISISFIVGILTNNNQTIEQWRLVFIITAAVPLSTGALYILFGKSELQPWNDVKVKEIGTELENLRPNEVEVAGHETSGMMTVQEMASHPNCKEFPVIKINDNVVVMNI